MEVVGWGKLCFVERAHKRHIKTHLKTHKIRQFEGKRRVKLSIWKLAHFVSFQTFTSPDPIKCCRHQVSEWNAHPQSLVRHEPFVGLNLMAVVYTHITRWMSPNPEVGNWQISFSGWYLQMTPAGKHISGWSWMCDRAIEGCRNNWLREEERKDRKVDERVKEREREGRRGEGIEGKEVKGWNRKMQRGKLGEESKGRIKNVGNGRFKIQD